MSSGALRDISVHASGFVSSVPNTSKIIFIYLGYVRALDQRRSGLCGAVWGVAVPEGSGIKQFYIAINLLAMSVKTLKINKNGEILIITTSGSENGGAMTEFEGKDEPGIGPPMHIHFLQEEKIKVLKGSMRVKSDSEEFSMKAGDERIFAAGVAHQFWNDGKEQNHYAGYLKPSYNWEYIIERVYDSANASNDIKPAPFDAAFLLTRYKSEIDLLVIPKPVKMFVFPVLYLLGMLLGKFNKYKGAPAPFR